MRITIIAMLMVAIATSAFSEKDWCTDLGDTAERIMTARQSGVPISQMMAIIPTDGNLGAIIRELTLMAYEQPLMQSTDYKQRVAREFGDSVEVVCYRAGARNG